MAKIRGIGRLMELADLLKEVLLSYEDAFRKKITKTKLLKLAYLVEVEFFRRSRERLTSATWKYYLYGPYVFEYDEILEKNGFETKSIDLDDERKAELIFIKLKADEKHTDSDIHFLVGRIVREFGALDLRHLLDYVYFETEPMMNVDHRMEVLEFENVLPEEYYKTRELSIDKKTQEKLSGEFKKKVEAIRGKRNS
jgi:uncharacterized phage-associated protein